jgi:hypothetical protein
MQKNLSKCQELQVLFSWCVFNTLLALVDFSANCFRVELLSLATEKDIQILISDCDLYVGEISVRF